MNLKKGEYIIAIEGGEIDLYDLVHNSQEFEYVSKIKESLEDEGLFPSPKYGELDILSIAAIIVYIDELSVLMSDENSSSKDVH